MAGGATRPRVARRATRAVLSCPCSMIAGEGVTRMVRRHRVRRALPCHEAGHAIVPCQRRDEWLTRRVHVTARTRLTRMTCRAAGRGYGRDRCVRRGEIRALVRGRLRQSRHRFRTEPGRLREGHVTDCTSVVVAQVFAGTMRVTRQALRGLRPSDLHPRAVRHVVAGGASAPGGVDLTSVLGM